MSAVYFIQCGDGGPVKIGKANDVEKRLTLLQIGSPYSLTLLGIMAGGRVDESELHRRFASSRMRGEWFAPTEELRAFIAAETTLPVAPEPEPVDLTSVRGMILSLGGTTATARLLGLPIKTVQGWKKKDHMPHYRRPALESAMAESAAA